MTTIEDRAFEFLRINERDEHPRRTGLTEIRGPYYSAYGPKALGDLLDAVGAYVDTFKFPGAVLPVLPKDVLTEFITICHDHEVQVSTGGLVEFALQRGPKAVEQYFERAAELRFDIVEISTGMLSVSFSDYLNLIRGVKAVGLRAKAEVGIQFGAGGTSSVEELAAEGTADPWWAVAKAHAALKAGADLIMLESEGVTEQVTTWKTDVPALFIREIGLDRVMFEASDPAVFGWYVKNYGAEVNLFVDHSQIYQLECLRRGIWGTKDLFGRVITFKGTGALASNGAGSAEGEN
jgi:phosphosulfolactate synthase (CoM biosynthesis protein A)